MVFHGKPMENPWKTHGKPMGSHHFFHQARGRRRCRGRGCRQAATHGAVKLGSSPGSGDLGMVEVVDDPLGGTLFSDPDEHEQGRPQSDVWFTRSCIYRIYRKP